MKVLICVHVVTGPGRNSITFAQFFDVFDQNAELNHGDIFVRLKTFHKDTLHSLPSVPYEDNIVKELLNISGERHSSKVDLSDTLLGDLYIHFNQPRTLTSKVEPVSTPSYQWLTCYDHDAGHAPSEVMYTFLPLISSSRNPGKQSIDKLLKISTYPPHQVLSEEEMALIRTYSKYVKMHYRNALHMLLKSFEFRDDNTESSFYEYLDEFDSPEDLHASLDLLSAGYRDFRSFVLKKCFSDVPVSELEMYLLQMVQTIRSEPQEEKSKTLNFLITRENTPFKIVNYVYWHMRVEKDLDDRVNELLELIPLPFRTIIENQEKFMKRLSEFYAVRKALNSETPQDLRSLERPIELPIDPTHIIQGIAQKFAVFKSNSSPVLLTMLLKDGGEYRVIYKEGDDLRQDQFIVQLIELMNRTLKKANLDLYIKTYKIIAVGESRGLVEFVNNTKPLKGLNILEYLDKANPEKADKELAHERFVRSCAGYCVFTYLLGIGDRNLDNLLITDLGQMFHIDFGYIFGNEPNVFKKLTRSKMKLSANMTAALGSRYKDFVEFASRAFEILKGSTNLIIVLTRLMSNSKIEQVKEDAIQFLQETLSVSSSTFLSYIEESRNNFTDSYVEAIHTTAKMLK